MRAHLGEGAQTRFFFRYALHFTHCSVVREEEPLFHARPDSEWEDEELVGLLEVEEGGHHQLKAALLVLVTSLLTLTKCGITRAFDSTSLFIHKRNVELIFDVIAENFLFSCRDL